MLFKINFFQFKYNITITHHTSLDVQLRVFIHFNLCSGSGTSKDYLSRNVIFGIYSTEYVGWKMSLLTKMFGDNVDYNDIV